MAARARLQQLEYNPFSPLSEISSELARIQAAMWLIDQVETGDLSFLADPQPSFNCWTSFVSMSPGDLRYTLLRMAQKTIDAALRAASGSSRAGGHDGDRGP
jgi:hypothetical protein